MSPSITDWIMVGVTIAYVVATIFIFRANKKSAEAAENQLHETKKQMEASKKQFEEQLAETKRQYEENKRLSVMPYFQCDYAVPQPHMGNREKVIEIKADCKSGTQHHGVFDIKNIGLGTAKDIKYQLVNLSGTNSLIPFVFQSAVSGESHINSFNFIIPFDQNTGFSLFFDLLFRDLLDNNYSQRIEFKFIRDENVGTFTLETITQGIVIHTQEQNNA